MMIYSWFSKCYSATPAISSDVIPSVMNLFILKINAEEKRVNDRVNTGISDIRLGPDDQEYRRNNRGSSYDGQQCSNNNNHNKNSNNNNNNTDNDRLYLTLCPRVLPSASSEIKQRHACDAFSCVLRNDVIFARVRSTTVEVYDRETPSNGKKKQNKIHDKILLYYCLRVCTPRRRRK